MEDYQKQKDHNEGVFEKGIQIMRPDIFVLMKTLDETGVDYTLILQIMHSLQRVAEGSKYGEVRIFIENGVATFVRGEESKKVNIPILKEDPIVDNH